MKSQIFQEIYDECINSPSWKKKRKEFIYSNKNDDQERACGDPSRCYTCDRCGWNYREDELEVHHKNYHTFRNESRCDVLVLCKCCHKIEDRIRAQEGQNRSEEALDDAQFYGWLVTKYGEDNASLNYDSEMEYERFCEWRERKEDEWW